MTIVVELKLREVPLPADHKDVVTLVGYVQVFEGVSKAGLRASESLVALGYSLSEMDQALESALALGLLQEADGNLWSSDLRWSP